MEENLKWVWAAFSVAWALHLLYVYSLSSRQKKLRDEMKNLRAQLEDRESDE